MDYLKNLDDEKIAEVIEMLKETREGLWGLVTLLTQLRGLDFSGDDLKGVGKLIEGQYAKLSTIEEILEYGEPQDE